MVTRLTQMIVLGTMGLFSLAHCGLGAVVYVDCNALGPDHDGASWDTAFLTIQEGVDAATPGGEVWVADGVYVENVVMGEGVAIYGGFLGAEPGGYETSLEQRDSVNNIATIDGNELNSCVTMAVNARADGFTVTNGYGKQAWGSWYGGGFYCESLGETGVIANNVISDNWGGTAGGGIFCASQSSPTIQGNTISRNWAYSGGGICCRESSSPTIADNVIADNSAEYTSGIECYESSPTIYGNTISGNASNQSTASVTCFVNSSAVIRGNEITGNTGSGISCGAESSPTVAANSISDNFGVGLWLGYKCASTVTDNTITGNTWGGVFCFDRCSPSLLTNVIAGNSTSGWGGGISCSTLASPTVTNNVIAENYAEWDGGGIYCTNRSSPIVAGNLITRNSTGGSGGGVYCEDECSPSIRGNTITGNSAAEHGGGIFSYGCSVGVASNYIADNVAGYDGGGLCCCWIPAPTVADNVILGNSAGIHGGGICCNYSSPTLTDNVIERNSAGVYGGGISCYWESAPTVTGNTIARNAAAYGAGVHCDASSPTLNGNLIGDNTAASRGGGVFCYSAAPILTNNILARNSANHDGGGLFCYRSSSPAVTNNTITRNWAGYEGGGICCWEASPTVSNNAVTENAADDRGAGICSDESSAPLLSHNDFWGNSADDYSGCEPGEGDISADPMFVNPEGGNWHLSFGSPCVDAGTNYAEGFPETDWEGEARAYDGDGDQEEPGVYATADMGADEFVPFVATAPDPEPECEGPLFGTSQAGLPAWVWFSIPIDPDACCNGDDCYNPATLLGFPVSGHLWRWDKYSKTAEVYKTGFAEWNLAVGEGYLLFLWTDVPNPSYLGISPFTPWSFEHKLGRQGWTWIGMPGLTELAGEDFMSSVKVKYPSDETGCYRTASQDYEAIPDNWIAWGWPYWNTWRKCMEVFTPYAPFGHRTCYPWLGYRVWVNVGTATSEDDPDQVTIMWPKGQ